MDFLNSFKTNIFQINNQNFEEHALKLFSYQFQHNSIYRAYVQNLGIHKVDTLDQIPYLPIQFFKKHEVKTGDFSPEHVFESSGTTGINSKHYISDLEFYREICKNIFSGFFGDIRGSVVIGLLPSYLERNNSSLVYMVDHFIRISQNELSGFYLNNQVELAEKLLSLNSRKVPVYLFGVTFALLELAGDFPLEIGNVHIIETGGMKGRGRELTREELHERLRTAFNTLHVYSEYGMTELLSQAYMQKDGLFHTPGWMRVKIRDIYDPFDYVKNGKTGGINVIDLANVHSCAFIETEDIGMAEQGGFKVLGRMDNTELRGCNLLLP